MGFSGALLSLRFLASMPRSAEIFAGHQVQVYVLSFFAVANLKRHDSHHDAFQPCESQIKDQGSVLMERLSEHRIHGQMSHYDVDDGIGLLPQNIHNVFANGSH